MSPAPAKHTPGPWTFAKGPHRIEVHTTPALAYAFSLSDEANARLIAAAPDMLNLLTAASRLDELTGENLSVYARTFAALARSAIAKATGGALNPDLSPQ